MTDDDESVRGLLGLDVGEDYSIPDSVWGAALDAAFDPDTAMADPALVPEMDDDGDIAPVFGAGDDATMDHHPGADTHQADHVIDDLHLDDSHGDDVHLDDHGHGVDHDPGAHEAVDPHPDHSTDHDWHG